MVALRDRRLIAAVTVGALVLACAGAGAVFLQPAASSRAEDNAARGALQVRQDVGEGRAEGGAPLRCFVDGHFVATMTIAACAQRNGISAQGLDVGLANTTAAVTPRVDDAEPAGADPRAQVPADEVAATSPEPAATPCLRFVEGTWRSLGDHMPLGACARALYQGRCVAEGEALYGRFGALSLRLVPGRVETSDDDRHFRMLVAQNDDCTLDD